MSKKGFSDSELEAMSPKEFRSIVRRGEWREVDINVCRGYAQANLAIVPRDGGSADKEVIIQEEARNLKIAFS